MKLGEKIVAAEERIDELKAEVADIIKTAAEQDDRDLTDEEVEQVSELEGEIDSTSKSLQGLRSAEKALAQRAARREDGRKTNTVSASVADNEKPGQLLVKHAVCAILAQAQRKNIMDVAQERYGYDPRVTEIVKSATEPGTTTRVGWAAELVDTQLAGFLQELTAVSIYGAMSSSGIAIPFGSANAITIPRRSGNNQVPGSFVQESATIPVKEAQFASQTLNRYKMAVITAYSRELAQVSNPQIEGVLRDAIIIDTALTLDAHLMDPTKSGVAGVYPGSPWNGAANQPSAGNTLDNILTDLRFLLDTLSAANSFRRPRMIMNPARLSGLNLLTNANGAFVFRSELSQGSLLGVPVTVSTSCPADQVYIVDAADFATAFGVPSFEVTQQATLVMASDDGTDPTMSHGAGETPHVDTGGSINVSDAAGTTPPTVVRSLFQTHEEALKMVMPISWAMLRTGVAAYLTGVGW